MYFYYITRGYLCYRDFNRIQPTAQRGNVYNIQSLLLKYYHNLPTDVHLIPDVRLQNTFSHYVDYIIIISTYNLSILIQDKRKKWRNTDFPPLRSLFGHEPHRDGLFTIFGTISKRTTIWSNNIIVSLQQLQLLLLADGHLPDISNVIGRWACIIYTPRFYRSLRPFESVNLIIPQDSRTVISHSINCAQTGYENE